MNKNSSYGANSGLNKLPNLGSSGGAKGFSPSQNNPYLGYKPQKYASGMGGNPYQVSGTQQY